MKARRKAIDCKLVEASKTSPGYFKYQVTIQEIDGSVNVVPAYGKDMQDAIERLLWNERLTPVTDNSIYSSILLGLMITCAVLCGILAARYSQPWYIAIGFGIPVTVGVVLNRIDKYLNR
jgi:hypothetical protein